MALSIPTTKELADQNLSRLESAIGQTAPINEQAFLRVLAVLEAMMGTSLFKYAAERARQNLAITATGTDLDRLGSEYDTTRKLSASTVLTATLPAITGTTIPATASFIGAANGIRYFLDYAVTAVEGVATLSLTAEVPGTVGNLQVTDVLTIVSPVAGAGQTAAVTAIATTGADPETDAAFRPRVLFAMRATTGGSNATDHKIWAEAVPGVLRAFPFAGKPVGGGTSYPGDRTVYVECDPSIQPDGIAPVGLLDDVRAACLVDPLTGRTRTALGLTDDTLYVQAIARDSVVVTIENLTTPTGQDAAVKSAISDALGLHFRSLVSYVEGVDLVQDRNDKITSLTVSQVVQEVLSASGSSAKSVAFAIGGTTYDSYQLEPGQLAKLGTITYATV